MLEKEFDNKSRIWVKQREQESYNIYRTDKMFILIYSLALSYLFFRFSWNFIVSYDPWFKIIL